MKILSIVCARPQFIKAAIVSKKLKGEGIKENLLHIGQYYDFDMSGAFLLLEGIKLIDFMVVEKQVKRQ